MTNQIICRTQNGKPVYLDAHSSHAATHIAEKPELLGLAKEVISSVNADEENVYIDKDFGRTVGLSDLVKTNKDDTILYAKRYNRDNFTRFVLNRDPEPTSKVTVVLRKNNIGGYDLWSVWIGAITPQFPGSEHESPGSRFFWKNHALVWNGQSVQAGTETEEWPWG